MKRRLAALFLVVALCWAGSARAILVDPYDNVLAPDGFYALGYFNYYTADELTGPSGDKLEGSDFELTATVGIARVLAYKHIGPVPLAFQVIVPFGKVEGELEFDGVSVLDEDSSGLGDVIFGPGVFLYTNDESGTYFSYWFYAFAPTGEWDKNQTINLGQNHWYFEHQLAYNQLFGKFVFDMNLNYYHHTEESDQNLKRPPRLELETSLGYQVTEKLILGVNAGGYWDVDEAEVDGSSVDDTKAKRVQFGPTLGYQITERLGANLRWTHDISAANDTKGDDVWLRASYAF